MSYRNPESLPDGDIVIFGTGQSGCQIAEDCHLAGRKVHLAVGSALDHRGVIAAAMSSIGSMNSVTTS